MKRSLVIALSFLGAALVAYLVVGPMDNYASRVFNHLLPGTRIDDMNFVEALPWLAVLPIAGLATTFVHRRRWPLYLAPILSGLVSALVSFANGYLVVRSLTL